MCRMEYAIFLDSILGQHLSLCKKYRPFRHPLKSFVFPYVRQVNSNTTQSLKYSTGCPRKPGPFRILNPKTENDKLRVKSNFNGGH